MKRRKSTKQWKKRLFKKKKNRQCFYCGKKLTLETATFDHVKPLSKGGYDRFKNGVIACHTCNQKKGNGDLDRKVAAIGR